MEEIEDFDALLARLPRADGAAWRAAAVRELRGKPLDSIAVALGGGVTVAPYSSATASEAPHFPQYGCSLVADLRAVPHLSEADALAELEGGAQGLWLPPLSGSTPAMPAVRFDYLTTVCGGSGIAERLRELIPASQRPAARVWALAEAAGASALLDALAVDFPLAAAVVDLTVPAAEGAPLDLAQAMVTFREALGTQAGAKSRSGDVAFAVDVPGDYLRALVELRALRYAYAAVCAEVDAGGHAAPLRLWARVSAPRVGHGTAAEAPAVPSAEDFLIDASVRAVAALTAGAEALTIVPYPGGEPAVQRRRARNVGNVLLIESDFAYAADALRGAAWVESAALAMLERARMRGDCY